MPCYRDFFTPKGIDLGAGTAVTGLNNEKLIITIEAFPDPETMRASIPMLDALRPHLARAVSLASELQLRECRSAVAALERVGAGAAFLNERGQVIAANDAFASQLGITLLDMRDRLHLTQRTSDAALGLALARLMTTGLGASIGIRDELGIGIAALHLIPVQKTAREVFVSNAVIALVSRPAQKGAPDAGLIQTLFDLTPAEAAVARAITNGESVESVARDTGKSVETVRSHLKRVFSKTATGRQSELSNLLRGFAPPALL
jgi:DNA-binding CsgD family transcriptional regulator